MTLKKFASIPAKFSEMTSELEGDKNFCAVIAVAAITKEPVKKVQELLAKNGRETGKGTETCIMKKVLIQLGYDVKVWSLSERVNIILSYPAPHNALKSITTHHPRRFPSSWYDKPDMLMFSNTHVSAYVDGVVCDWAIKTSKRIQEIWTVEKVK